MSLAKPEARYYRWKFPQWARQVLPVLISAGIITYYLRELEWRALVEASRRANLTTAFAAILIPQLVGWFMGALMVERTMHWFHAPFPLKAYFWVRGASYVLAFINSSLQNGGLIVYQKYRADITWTRLLGIVLFRVGLYLWLVGIIMIPATAALHHYGLAEKAFGSEIVIRVWWGILVFPGALFLVGSWIYWFFGIDYTGLSKIIVRDREHEFWTAFRISRPRHWLLLWAIYLPQMFVNVLAFYLLNLAFNIWAPLAEAVVVLPFAFVVMDLPVAFGGFGTMTLAWMTFFRGYGSAESIAALTLFTPMARMLCRAAIGLISLKPALSEINGLFPKPDLPKPPGPVP